MLHATNASARAESVGQGASEQPITVGSFTERSEAAHRQAQRSVYGQTQVVTYGPRRESKLLKLPQVTNCAVKL